MLIMWVESFWALFLVVLAAYVLCCYDKALLPNALRSSELIGSAYIALIDGGVLAVLWPDTALYGKQRLYGAVGCAWFFLCVSMLIRALTDGAPWP